MYKRYLKRTWEKFSAARRKRMRENPEPCCRCGEKAEITEEGLWLCREHKAQWKALLPYKAHDIRLKEAGVEFLTEEEHRLGVVKPKKRKRQECKLVVKSWDYNSSGRAKPAPRKKK